MRCWIVFFSETVAPFPTWLQLAKTMQEILDLRFAISPNGTAQSPRITPCLIERWVFAHHARYTPPMMTARGSATTISSISITTTQRSEWCWERERESKWKILAGRTENFHSRSPRTISWGAFSCGTRSVHGELASFSPKPPICYSACWKLSDLTRVLLFSVGGACAQ